jgi:hypothetical protein
VFDGLVRRAVFPDADRVVRHHVDNALVHQRAKADGRAGIVREDEEGARVGNDAAVQRHAVHRRRHRMLADAPVHITAGIVVGSERHFGGRRARVVGAGEVGRPAHHFGNLLGQKFKRGAGPFAGGVSLGRFDNLLLVSVDGRGDIVRQLAGEGGFERRTLVRSVEALRPGLAVAGALRADLAPGLQHFVRDHEGFVRPVDRLADAGDFFRAIGAAMSGAGAGDLRRAEADDGLARDERGAVRVLRRDQRAAHSVHVVTVDARDVPA